MNSHLFVYGTLRKGHAREHRLLGDARFVARGSVSGKLYDLGRCPGLRRARSGAGRIRGELYELPDPDSERRLTMLDRYEGSEFQRARVLVRLEDGRRHRAWAYVLAKEPPKATAAILTGIYPKGGRRGQGATRVQSGDPAAGARLRGGSRRATS